MIEFSYHLQVLIFLDYEIDSNDNISNRTIVKHYYTAYGGIVIDKIIS